MTLVDLMSLSRPNNHYVDFTAGHSLLSARVLTTLTLRHLVMADLPLPHAVAVKFAEVPLVALAKLTKSQLIAFCIDIADKPANGATKPVWVARALSVRNQALLQLAAQDAGLVGGGLVPVGAVPAAGILPVQGNPFAAANPLPGAVAAAPVNIGLPAGVVGGLANPMLGVNPFAAIPVGQSRVSAALTALAGLPRIAAGELVPHPFYENYTAMSARVSLPAHYPPGSFVYCPSVMVSDDNPLTWSRLLDVPDVAVFEVLQHLPNGSVTMRLLGFLAQLVNPVALAAPPEFSVTTSLAVNSTVTIPLPVSVDMVMGNFQVTLTQSLRQPAEDLLPPGHQWLGVPPPVVSTNEVLLAITQQTQQLAIQRAVPAVAALQGKQPSASQSEAFPRMSRVLSLFIPTEQLRYFSDLTVPVGERLTADRIAPARPAQLVRLLLSQVYRQHEIPLKLSDDDLKHMMYLEFGQSSRQPISITMFTPRTLQTDPMISLGQAVNYASDFYSRLTQLSEWDALKSMYMTLSSYIAPNIFTVADIILLINNQLDDIPLYFMDVVTPVGVDPRQYIGHLLLGALTVDEDAVRQHVDRQVMALVSKGSVSASGSPGNVSGRNKRKYGASSSSSTIGGTTSTSGSTSAAAGRKGQSVTWRDSPIKMSEFPANKTPCYYWLCGKGTCANTAVCAQTVVHAHEFPANLEPKKDAYIDFIVNKIKYKFK
jgi:hypothetical protein